MPPTRRAAYGQTLRSRCTPNSASICLLTHTQLGLLSVELVHLDIPKEVCIERCKKQNEKFNQAPFEELAAALRPAGRKEGFTDVHVVHNEAEINALLAKLGANTP